MYYFKKCFVCSKCITWIHINSKSSKPSELHLFRAHAAAYSITRIELFPFSSSLLFQTRTECRPHNDWLNKSESVPSCLVADFCCISKSLLIKLMAYLREIGATFIIHFSSLITQVVLDNGASAKNAPRIASSIRSDGFDAFVSVSKSFFVIVIFVSCSFNGWGDDSGGGEQVGSRWR